jgi:hypothetical protein
VKGWGDWKNQRKESNMSRIRALLLLSAVLVAGCWPVLSVHPLYDEKTSFFDPGLIGDWVNDDGIHFIFRQSGDKAYEMVVMDDGKRSVFSAHLVRLRGQYYLDLYPNLDSLDVVFEDLASTMDSVADKMVSEYQALIYGMNLTFILPWHSFYRLSKVDSIFKMEILDDEEFKELIENGQVNIDYIEIEDRLILTARTEKLQRMIGMKSVNDAFEYFAELHRL